MEDVAPAWVTGEDTAVALPRRGSHNHPSAEYSRHFLARRRAKLIQDMGGVCAECGEDGENDALGFDHPHGRDYTPSKLSSTARIARYERDWRAGNLRLLYQGCNSAYRPGRG